MHDTDSRLEDRLRAALRDEARDLPFDIPLERVERRLDERRRAARWQKAGLAVAASAILAVGVGVAVLATLQDDQAPAATPSPSLPAVVASPSPSIEPSPADGLATFEELAPLVALNGEEVLRGEQTASDPDGATDLGSAGTGDLLTFVYSCTTGTLQIELRDAGVLVSRFDASCLDRVVRSGAGPALGGRGLDVRVTGPAGVPWRMIVVTPSAGASTAVEGCRPVSELNVHELQLDQAYASNGERVPEDGFRSVPGLPATGERDVWVVPSFPFDGPIDELQLWAQSGCVDTWRISVAQTAEVERALAAGETPGSEPLPVTMPTRAMQKLFLQRFDPDVILRIEVRWWSDGGPTVEEVRYVRIAAAQPEQTPSPTPVPVAHPDPTVPCAPEDLSARAAPDVSLRLGGTFIAKGDRGTESWGTSVTDSVEFAAEASIPVDSGDGLILTVDGNVCAISWAVSYAAVPADRLGHDPIADLVPVQQNPDRDPAFARENRFPLAHLPGGDWWIKADLSYANGGALMYWRITVPPAFVMPTTTFTSGDASVSGQGLCGGSFEMSTGEVGFDDCGPVFTPVAIQRALHVTAGSIVRVAVDRWQVARATGGIVTSARAIQAAQGGGLTFDDLPVPLADGAVTFTAPNAPGDWHVTVHISGTRSDGSKFEQGFLIRLIVDG